MKSKDIKDTRAEKAEEQVKPKEESEAQTELDHEAMGDDKYIEALEEGVIAGKEHVPAIRAYLEQYGARY